MGNIFWSIYRQPLHYIVLYMVLLVAIWACIGTLKKIRRLWAAFNILVFLGIVMVILYMAVYNRVESSNEIILIPFYSFIEAKMQPELYRSMLMNVFLFVPIGLSLPFIVPGRLHPVFVTAAAAFLFSIFIEYIQYRYSLGRCEVDDVIMNTAGAVVGSLAYVTSGKISEWVIDE